MKIKSFAKINLGIEVIRKREDGYHDIRTLFQTIDLFDIMEFRLLASGEIRLQGDDETIPWDENNLIYKAALLVKARAAPENGVSIEVIKKIPPGSGLGGGSGNAATTLLALNDMWGLRLSKEVLLEEARKLGADVPYFLEGGLCLGEGRGDILTPMEDIPPLPCVLLLPQFPVSTKEVYEHFRSALTSAGKASKINQFLTRKNLGQIENRLEKTIFGLYPQLKDFKNLLRREGAVLALVSGTGSAVFGIFPDQGKAEQCFRTAEKRTRALLVETLSRERYQVSTTLGCSQAVRQRTLDPSSGGSNPPAPALEKKRERRRKDA